MHVTVTGGDGKNALGLNFMASQMVVAEAQALATAINANYSQAIYYRPSAPPLTPSAGYLVIKNSVSANDIQATGFGAIVDQNITGATTIHGGDNAGGQIVLAGNGGLTFDAAHGAVTVAASGGTNDINFRGDTASVAAYTGNGSDTIYGGNGNTVISTSAGTGRIVLGGGASLVQLTGADTISLGAGQDTIDVIGRGSAVVGGASSVAGSGFSLVFIGGAGSSTVLGGAGSYSVTGGTGGGVFHGGSAGDNSITGGHGAVTIYGGGAGDTLLGGFGNDFIAAGLGNETLGGGAGANVFDLSIHSVEGKGGAGTTDVVLDFRGHDLLDVGGIANINYALNTFDASGGIGTFSLLDGTKVVLDGVTHLTAADFKGG